MDIIFLKSLSVMANGGWLDNSDPFAGSILGIDNVCGPVPNSLSRC